MSPSTVAVLARLLADAATTIELADEDAISLDLATVVLEDLAAGFGALSEGDRTVVALTIRDYAIEQQNAGRRRVMLALPETLGLSDEDE